MESGEFYITYFNHNDYEAVNELWQQTGMGGAVRGDNLKVIQNTLTHGGKLILLKTKSIDDIVIGTSWITNDYRRLYLHHFAILPGFQGKGLSKLLLEASLNYARELQMQIKLEVHKENEIARNLYQKGGFTYLGDYLVYIIRDVNIFHE